MSLHGKAVDAAADRSTDKKDLGGGGKFKTGASCEVRLMGGRGEQGNKSHADSPVWTCEVSVRSSNQPLLTGRACGGCFCLQNRGTGGWWGWQPSRHTLRAEETRHCLQLVLGRSSAAMVSGFLSPSECPNSRNATRLWGVGVPSFFNK